MALKKEGGRMATKDEKLFDIRLVEKNIAKGLITQDDYQKYLKSLKDDKAEVKEVILNKFSKGENS